MSSPLDLFTAIRIHGLTRDANGDPVPLTLKRTVSFPSPTWTGGPNKRDGEPFHRHLAARELPEAGYQLEARISASPVGNHEGTRVGGLIGQGRSAFVFSLDVIDVSRPTPTCHGTGKVALAPALNSAELIKASLPQLSLKLAKPTYSRSLAREAWFYEKLDAAGLLNVVTPRHYGLFHTNLCHLPSTHKLDIPHYDSLVERHFSSHPEGTTLLPDETRNFTCVDDEFSTHKTSPWYQAREDRNAPCITVLLMEKLGDPITGREFEEDETELDDIFDDICEAKIQHGDHRFPNLLRAPADAACCPNHHRSHRWFWVDWEDSLIAHHSRALSYVRESKENLSYWAKGVVF
ncbi:protein kinase subdomain-containing protein PKL/ccin3 [Coprinopsis sp. MPI-PUGE-AT-0042]|nr:protein kinase subdomain-containing protein PKL/ccin3 [Coprinopsis sp. MPI-PUGE-AT-0042]